MVYGKKKSRRASALLVNAMLDLLVPCQSILARKGLFVVANLAASLLSGCVVDCVFVPCQVVGTRKDCIARLASCRVDP